MTYAFVRACVHTRALVAKGGRMRYCGVVVRRLYRVYDSLAREKGTVPKH